MKHLFLLLILLLTASMSRVDFAAAQPALVAQPNPVASQADVALALQNAPVMFIENVGQFYDDARFHVRGGDYDLWGASDAIGDVTRPLFTLVTPNSTPLDNTRAPILNANHIQALFTPVSPPARVPDSTLTVSTFIGGTDWDVGNSLTLDSVGNAVVTGASNTPTATNTPTNTVPTSTVPTPTATATNTPTNTVPTPTATATNTPTNTVPTSTATATNTPTNAVPTVPTSTATATNTPTNTVPPTSTATATNTPTISPVATNTPTNAVPPTSTANVTNTPTIPPTATNTPTNTVPPTSTANVTNTPTIPPTATASPTNTVTATPTNTATATPTNTATVMPANQAPNMPHDPTPADGASNIPTDLKLSWQGDDPDNEPLTYNVAFGTDNPPPIIASAVITTSYNPGLLSADTLYYWFISASDGISTTVGEVWSFTTTSSTEPQSFDVGAEGTTFVSNNGTTIIEIPAGSLSETTAFTYTPMSTPSVTSPEGLEFAGVAFDLLVQQSRSPRLDSPFTVPVTVTVRYSDADISQLDESALEVRYLDGSAWSTPLPVVFRDAGRNRLEVTTTNAAQFALFAPTRCVPVAGVTVVGPSEGQTGVEYTFTAVITPTAASLPITYNWSPEPSAGQGTLAATYSWDSSGTSSMSLAASNCKASATASDSTTILVTAPEAPSTGDAYESDDACVEAQSIETDGSTQLHTFHDAGDSDWLSFSATAGTNYLIEARVPPTATTDVALELYENCAGNASQEQDHSFATEVRLLFSAPTSGDYYLRLSDHDSNVYGTSANYSLSVQPAEAPANGALVLVAGKLRDNDSVQSNIHHITNEVYQLSLANGCSADDIYYLASDTSLPGVDAPATTEQLEFAISQWAPNRVGADKRFTFYLMDHGGPDIFYLNGASATLNPKQLNNWLGSLEAQVPDLESNIIIEACYSGSFIEPPQSISQQGRLVMTSAGSSSLAYASSEGAIFSDKLFDTLGRGQTLATAFSESQWTASQAHADQTPWLDVDGDGVPNEAEDTSMALNHGFACAGPPTVDQWAPNISSVQVRELTDGNIGIWANVQDDKDDSGQGVSKVWALVYPPSYQPPSESEELVQEEQFLDIPPLPMISTNVAELYGTLYPAFNETGSYRVVIYAVDEEGLVARPQLFEFQNGEPVSGHQIYLPLVQD